MGESAFPYPGDQRPMLVGRFHGSNHMPTKIGSLRCSCGMPANQGTMVAADRMGFMESVVKCGSHGGASPILVRSRQILLWFLGASAGLSTDGGGVDGDGRVSQEASRASARVGYGHRRARSESKAAITSAGILALIDYADDRLLRLFQEVLNAPLPRTP